LGHVVYAPPIASGVGPDQHTQDVAVMIDVPEIDRRNFAGNVTDLGFKYTIGTLTPMMYPNPKNVHNFDFPVDRLLSLRDTIPDSEMHKPKMLTTTTTPANTVALIGSIHMFLEEPQRYRDEGPEIASAIHYRWEYCLLVDRLMTELGLQAPRNRICLLWSQYAWDDEADWHMPKEERKQRWETITKALHIGPRRTEEKR